VQAAERAGIARAAESHELVRDHVHGDVLWDRNRNGGVGGGGCGERESAVSPRGRPCRTQGVHSGLEPPFSRPLPAPQPESARLAGTPSSCAPRPTNLGRLAHGLRQLLSELREESVGHGGAGHVGVHDEHRHDGREAAGPGWEHQATRAARKQPGEPELRDHGSAPPPAPLRLLLP
jgi:hypothetical protein